VHYGDISAAVLPSTDVNMKYRGLLLASRRWK